MRYAARSFGAPHMRLGRKLIIGIVLVVAVLGILSGGAALWIDGPARRWGPHLHRAYDRELGVRRQTASGDLDRDP
jgi:hypothetical protein